MSDAPTPGRVEARHDKGPGTNGTPAQTIHAAAISLICCFVAMAAAIQVVLLIYPPLALLPGCGPGLESPIGRIAIASSVGMLVGGLLASSFIPSAEARLIWIPVAVSTLAMLLLHPAHLAEILLTRESSAAIWLASSMMPAMLFVHLLCGIGFIGARTTLFSRVAAQAPGCKGIGQ